jgi:ubiquinone/menaquinone biosynthesis C-methylase UbiE
MTPDLFVILKLSSNISYNEGLGEQNMTNYSPRITHNAEARSMEKENCWFFQDKRKFKKAKRLLSPCFSERGGTWADFGCGEGIFTAVLYELLGPKCKIYAVDKNQRALNKLKHNFLNAFPHALIQIDCADFTTPLSLPPLDGFILANALHFIQDNQKEVVLAGLSRLLKPEGIIIIIEYNTNRSNYAVPFPIPEGEFLKLADQINLQNAHIVTRVPSSFLGEMYAGMAIAPVPNDLSVE